MVLLTSSNGNQYIFLESARIGKGSLGKIFTGFDQKAQQKVAIKRVSKKILDKNGEEFFRCLENDTNTFQKMSHGHIVGIIDCFMSENDVYIIMEYCEGGNLANLLKAKGGRFIEEEAVNHLNEIVDGLHTIHRAGYMHRDLKLENILLKEAHCKISDFRFAILHPKSDQYVGTQEYMAPEIVCCGGGNFYDKQVDIWALGIMFHEMLFGDCPYKGESSQIRDIISNNPYQPPSFPVISEESRDLLQRMLKFDPTERITVEEIRRHPLLAFAGILYLLWYFTEYLDLGISTEVKRSLTESIIKENVNHIFTKLDNYRKCCEFFMFLFTSLKPYMTSEKGFILDDLHVFTYYLLKFAHNKFSFLYRYLEKGECPDILLKAVETEYWKNFLESENFVALKADTFKEMDLIRQIFIQFRVPQLEQYLIRTGQDSQQLETIYADNIYMECTAGFTGHLLGAIYKLQNLSLAKKDAMGDEARKILMDLEFVQLVLDNIENYEIEIDVESIRNNEVKFMDI